GGPHRSRCDFFRDAAAAGPTAALRLSRHHARVLPHLDREYVAHAPDPRRVLRVGEGEEAALPPGLLRTDGAPLRLPRRSASHPAGQRHRGDAVLCLQRIRRRVPRRATRDIGRRLLLLPWIVTRAYSFNAHNTVYRGLRFRFHGSLSAAAWTFLLRPLALIVSFGLYYPAWARARREYVVTNHRLGDAYFRFTAAT